VDQRRYLEGGLVDVRCLDCQAAVRARKNSVFHTSIQWTAQARRECMELSRRGAGPGGRAAHESCSRLRASIAEAVEEGRLPVGRQDA
jgi:hypothetical protein